MSSEDELKVVDADGEEVAAGDVGELLNAALTRSAGRLSLSRIQRPRFR